MLDVHPPHQPAHTWKDFFIHIATIVIGLLIAVGLEQTVEWMHHRHQREQLQSQLVIEAQNNFELMKLDYIYFDQEAPILAALRKDAVGLHPSSTPHPVDLHTIIGAVETFYPDSPVWNTAKEGGVVALLPRRQAAFYDLVYTQQGLMTDEFHKYDQARAALGDFSLRYTVGPRQTLDLAGMSPDEARQYLILLANLQGELARFRAATDYAQGVTQMAAHGETDEEQAFRKIGVTQRH